MIATEMSDTEVADQMERTARFVAELRELIAATVVDPTSPCADEKRSGLRRIADTVDQVDYIVLANLANIDTALRGGLLSLIEVQLMAVGGGPTLDYADAAEFLAGFGTIIEKVRRRRLQ